MTEIVRPLDGVKIVELATFVAGSCCCRYLADLGADVIKVEGIKGDNLRYTAINEGRPYGDAEDTTYTLENANKRAVILDLKTGKGREVFHRLLAQADIFVTNWRPGALQRAGLDYESLKEKYPALVMGLVSGNGEKGPEKNLPGYDLTSYFARSGVMGALYDANSVPMLPCAGFGDHQVGMFLSSGILAALYRAQKTGKGDKVTVGLLQAGLWDVSLNLTASQYGDPNMQYPVARETVPNQLQLPHKTADGQWLMIAVPSYDLLFNKFISAIGREDLVNDERFYPQKNAVKNLKELHDTLAETFAQKPIAEWQAILAEADIPASKCYTWNELLVDEQCWENDYLAEVEFPSGNKRTLVRPPVTFAETPLHEYNRAPFLGEHTEEVLAQLGYDEGQISEILESGYASNVQRIG